MLAAWFRMKSPNILDGAVASSAPIWSFYDLDPPYNDKSFAQVPPHAEGVPPSRPLPRPPTPERLQQLQCNRHYEHGCALSSDWAG